MSKTSFDDFRLLGPYYMGYRQTRIFGDFSIAAESIIAVAVDR